MNKGMVKVSVLYPDKEGSKFDMDYYLNTHGPLVEKTLGEALKGLSVNKGLGGGAPGAPAPFVTMTSLYFDSMEEFEQAFGPAVPTLLADLPNFTNIEPVIQVSEVMI